MTTVPALLPTDLLSGQQSKPVCVCWKL